MKNKENLCIAGRALLVLGILAALAVNTASSQETQSDANMQEKTSFEQQLSEEDTNVKQPIPEKLPVLSIPMIPPIDVPIPTIPSIDVPIPTIPSIVVPIPTIPSIVVPIPTIPPIDGIDVPPPYYKCYKIERKVNLLTQFSLEMGVDVQEKDEFLCAPALKNPTGTLSQQLQNLTILQKNFPHLKFYGIDAPAINVPVSLSSSQFGNETVNVTKPVFLGLPAAKGRPPQQPLIQPADPHYKCYIIEPVTKVNRFVALRTQFNFPPFGNDLEEVFVNESRFLCAPALKNPKGSASSQNKTLRALEKNFPHLKLYSIDTLVIPNIPLNLRTQFGTELNVNITRPLYLAVPVKKEEQCPIININMNLNTGFNQSVGGGLIGFNFGDDDWNVVNDTVNPASRSATVVNITNASQIQVWPAPFPNSRWISVNAARGFGQYGGRNVTYQYNFTLPSCFRDEFVVKMDLNITADNRAWIYVNNKFVAQPADYPAVSTINVQETGVLFFFRPGTNNLTVVVQDFGGITGFNLNGMLTAQ